MTTRAMNRSRAALHALEEVILAEARTEISYADHKASTLLAALGIGFGAFLGGLFASQWKPTDLVSWGEVAWWAGGLCALTSVLFAALAVWPRISNPPEEAEVVYYWGHVARFSTLEELSKHLDENPAVHAERTRNQMWRISRIVRRKYTMIRISMSFAGVAVCLFLISGLSLL